MVRSTNWKLYILTSLVCLVFVLISFSAVIYLENSRLSNLEGVLEQQNLVFKKFQTYELTNQVLGESGLCSGFEPLLESFNNDLVKSLRAVEAFGNNLQNEKFEIFFTEYLIDNIRYWALFEQIDQECNIEDKVSILYFHSQTSCPSCSTQGKVLTNLRLQAEGDLLVFPLNIDFSEREPLIEFVEEKFNITSYPSFVINGRVYSDFRSEQQILNVICEEKPFFNLCN